MRKLVQQLIAVSLLAFLLAYGQADAAPILQAFSQQATLLPSDPAAGNQMGYAVTLRGTQAVIGVPGDADRGVNSGSAYIMHANSDATQWTKESKVTAPDAAPNDRFGAAVYIFNTYAMIGAPARGSNQGAVYVYQLKGGDSWTWIATLTASDGAAGDQFGTSIHIGTVGGSVSRAVIGAPGKSAGAVYIFDIDENVATPTWTQQVKVTSGDGAAGDKFGAAVYTAGLTPGEFLIVSAPNDDDLGTDSGSVYVYTLTAPNTWTQETKLTASDGAANDHFGSSLWNLYAASKLTLVVGAPDADPTGTDSGAAYTFTRNNGAATWAQQTKLTPLDGSAGDQFGADVDGTIDYYAVIGAPGDDDKGADSGSGYIFNYTSASNSWAQGKKLTGSTSAAGDHFGSSVSITPDFAIAGAALDAAEGTQSGSVYAYRFSDNWVQKARIIANNTFVNDRFGSSFAVDGNYAVVGAAYDADGGGSGLLGAMGAGAAYIYVRSGNTWTQQARLSTGDGGSTGQFGTAVAISGDTVLVNSLGASAVYVYVRNGTRWVQQAKLTSGNSNFGRTLALDGDLAVISGDGNRYFYQRTGTTWSIKNTFGGGSASALSLEGNRALVGVNADGGHDSGVVYVYDRSGTTWSLSNTITPPSGGNTAQDFGAALDLNGTSLVVGAPRRDEGGSDTGAAFVYTYSAGVWTLQQMLTHTSPQNSDSFGSAVTLENDRVTVGISKSPSKFDQAIIFTRVGSTWTQRQTLIPANSTTYEFSDGLTLENGELWGTAPRFNPGSQADSGTVYFFLYTPDTDMGITGTEDFDPIIAGFDLTYTLTITNNGPENTTGVTVTSTLPSTLTFVEGSSGCGVNTGVVTCTIGSMNANTNAQITVTVNIDESAQGSLHTVFAVTSALGDTNAANDSVAIDTALVAGPDAPTPLTPTNGSTTTNTLPRFTWTAVSGADHYEIQFDIINPPENTYEVYTTNFTPPGPLLYYTYYWRVRAIDENGIPSVWSPLQTVTINSAVDIAPVRNVFDTPNPTLTWGSVSWATGYQVQLSDTLNFSGYLLETGTLPASQLSVVVNEPLTNGTWYWHVRALKADGINWSNWSTTEAFQIIVP